MAEEASATPTEESAVATADVDVTPESMTPEQLESALTEGLPEKKDEKTQSVKTKEKASTEPKKEPEKPAKEDETAVLRLELERLKKKIEHQDLFIQRQGNEVGQLRKMREQLMQLAEQKRLAAQEQFYTNPTQAMDSYQQAQQASQQAQQYEVAEAMEANRVLIEQTFPDYRDMIRGIAEVAIEDGVPEHFVRNFVQNPYATPIGVVLPYYKSAKRAQLYKEMQQKLESVKTQVAELDKTPETVVQNIKAAANKGPRITGGNAAKQVKVTPEIDINNIHNLSTAELERLLSEAK